MKEDSQLIDRLVREVLQRLAASGVTAGAATPPAGSDVLTVAERIVTLKSLQGKLSGVRSVYVQRQTVVTPSVRDELKRLGVQLLREGESPREADNGSLGNEVSAASSLLVATCETNVDVSPALALARTVRCESLGGGDLMAVMAKLTTAMLAAKRPGVLIAGVAAAALCLANRNYGIRAIAASDARQIESEAAGIGANLLVIDPNGRSAWEIANAIRAFARGGWRQCPESLRKTLGGV